MYYSTAIFRSAGLIQGNQAIYATITLGGINVAMTLATVFLVEKVGRKMLLSICYGVMTVFMALLTVCMIQTVTELILHHKVFEKPSMHVVFVEGNTSGRPSRNHQYIRNRECDLSSGVQRLLFYWSRYN